MNFDNLKDQVSNLTLYDLKAGVRKVQNGKPLLKTPRMRWKTWKLTVVYSAVMNYTEMEAKVPTLHRKARDPSSSSLPGSGSYE